MLKASEGCGVKTREIQEIRALLAAQASVPETAAPRFGALKGFWGRGRLAPAMPLILKAEVSDPIPPSPEEVEPLLLETEFAGYDDAPQPCETIPPGVLLGGLAPRRPAFGQRTEPVLDLKEAVSAEPHRLTLMGPNGAAVGEIILHADMAPSRDVKLRRPFEPLHSEAPFFPEDLADEPRPRAARPAKALPPPSPTPEMAATFLLATLAARLASEDAQLRRRLAA